MNVNKVADHNEHLATPATKVGEEEWKILKALKGQSLDSKYFGILLAQIDGFDEIPDAWERAVGHLKKFIYPQLVPDMVTIGKVACDEEGMVGIRLMDGKVPAVLIEPQDAQGIARIGFIVKGAWHSYTVDGSLLSVDHFPKLGSYQRNMLEHLGIN